jgi:cell division protein ZapA (FtsZ GTPase activity inhibitor)
MKRPVTVQIAGQKYTLRSDADEDQVRALASFVDDCWKDVQRQTRAADSQAVAVLTALRIAEELFGEREAMAALKRAIREQGENLLFLLEREAGL